MPHLSALYVYPVKSCRGVSLREAVLDERGLVHDRQFLIVDEENRFLTQRATPALARIGTALSEDLLTLENDRTGAVSVPWDLSSALTREVTVWRDTLTAYDAGNEAAAWLSDTLGLTCRLVGTGERSRREVPAGRVPDAYRTVASGPVPVAFSDAFPLLVLSEESVADLGRRIGEGPPPVNRFRPNLILAGCPGPYMEDQWQTYRVGEARLFSAGPCVRCVVTTTDQQTLARGPEPLRTLARYRRVPEGGVIFGQNVIHAQPGARLRVGDTVTVEA